MHTWNQCNLESVVVSGLQNKLYSRIIWLGKNAKVTVVCVWYATQAVVISVFSYLPIIRTFSFLFFNQWTNQCDCKVMISNCALIFFYLFIYTKYITSFTLDTQKLHKTHYPHYAQHTKHRKHITDFVVKIYEIDTHNNINSPQTHNKIILNTDLHHKLSDITDHFTRNFNFLLYNSDLYSSITMRVLSFTWKL